MSMTMEQLVDSYIKLRDKKDQMSTSYKQKVAVIDQMLDQIENTLLTNFTAQGVDSVKTPAGTAYRSTRSSATVADWDQVFNFIQANEAWEMLERRVNKSAVESFKAANDALPPGVNWREEVTVGVRRSN